MEWARQRLQKRLAMAAAAVRRQDESILQIQTGAAPKHRNMRTKQRKPHRPVRFVQGEQGLRPPAFEPMHAQRLRIGCDLLLPLFIDGPLADKQKQQRNIRFAGKARRSVQYPVRTPLQTSI